MLRQAKGMQKNTPWVDRFPNRAGVPKRHLKQGSFWFARENEAAGTADAGAWVRAGVCDSALR